MILINTWDPTRDFMTINPHFKVGDLANFYSSEKDKEHASKVLWAIAYGYDRDSMLFNWSLDSKIKFIEKEILKVEKSDLIKKYEKLISFYESLQETPAMRQLKMWNTKMDEKTEFLSKMKYSIATFENIEKMLSSNLKLYSDLERIQNTLEREGNVSKTKGDWEESLSESEDI